MSGQLVPLQEVWHHIPMALKSIYNRGSEGRLPWLTRIGPTGHRTRGLFVDVPLYDSWARARGIKVCLGDLLA